jgi:hypothetical protein
MMNLPSSIVIHPTGNASPSSGFSLFGSPFISPFEDVSPNNRFLQNIRSEPGQTKSGPVESLFHERWSDFGLGQVVYRISGAKVIFPELAELMEADELERENRDWRHDLERPVGRKTDR